MECSVCYERLQAPLKLSCKHSFCKACIEEWYISSPAETPGCPTCRRPIRNSSLDESRAKRQEDQLFGEVLDQYLDDWCEFSRDCLEDFGQPPDTWDHRLLLEDLSNVQQTIKVLKECALDDDEIMDFVDLQEWQTWKPFAPKGWIAWDPPSQKFFDESRWISVLSVVQQP